MDNPTTQPLEAPATFTNADRALLLAIAEKLNQPAPADLRDATASRPDVPGVLIPGMSAPAFDPGPTTTTFDTTGPITPQRIDPTNLVAQEPISPPSNIPTTAPAFEPLSNSPALSGLPQPAAPTVPRDSDAKFTAGQSSDLAAVIALLREKFPHSLPEEIPATL